MASNCAMRERGGGEGGRKKRRERHILPCGSNRQENVLGEVGVGGGDLGVIPCCVWRMRPHRPGSPDGGGYHSGGHESACSVWAGMNRVQF